MKKISKKFVWACVGSLLILYPVVVAQAAEKPILAKFSLQFPPKHHLVQAAKLFAKTVGEKSQGSIKIQVFPAGQIYQETEVMEAVATKSVEIGDILLERWAGVDQRFDALASNLYVVDNYALSWKIADGKVGAYFGEMMQKQGCYPIFWSCSGVFKGITNSKRPLIKPSDWKGLIIRVSTGPSGEQAKLFGASPILMSGGEAYDAMQRKTVDGSSTTLSSVLDRKYYEVQKYLTVFLDYPSYHPWIVNLKWWDGLPKEKRDILRQAALVAQEWDRKDLETVEADYIKKLQKLITTHIQTDAEAEEWANASQPMADEWLKKMGRKAKN